MRPLSLLTGLALLTSGIVLGRIMPQDDASAAARQDPTQPGPVHAEMNKRTGEYNVSSVMKFEGPGMDGMEPMQSDGTATVESILGGRFLLETWQGDMNGQPVESVKVWGYNNATNKLESVWLYTMSTGMLTMTGEMTEDGRLAGPGSYYDESGKQDIDIALSFPSETTHVVTMSHTMGEATATWESTYTPKKK